MFKPLPPSPPTPPKPVDLLPVKRNITAGVAESLVNLSEKDFAKMREEADFSGWSEQRKVITLNDLGQELAAQSLLGEVTYNMVVSCEIEAESDPRYTLQIQVDCVSALSPEEVERRERQHKNAVALYESNLKTYAARMQAYEVERARYDQYHQACARRASERRTIRAIREFENSGGDLNKLLLDMQSGESE